jgi:hypothetical protein
MVTSSYEAYRQLAEKFMAKYRAVQALIESIEERAVSDIGDKYVASVRLKQDQVYMGYVGDRRAYQEQATIFAQFALMYK